MESFENKFDAADVQNEQGAQEETGRIKSGLNSARRFLQVAAASFAMSTGALSASEKQESQFDQSGQNGTELSGQAHSYIEGNGATNESVGPNKKLECIIGAGVMERLDELHITHEEFVSEEDGKKKLSLIATTISVGPRENEPTRAFAIELDLEDDGADGIRSEVHTKGDDALIVELYTQDSEYEITLTKTDRLDGAVEVEVKKITQLPTDGFMSSSD